MDNQFQTENVGCLELFAAFLRCIYTIACDKLIVLTQVSLCRIRQAVALVRTGVLYLLGVTNPDRAQSMRSERCQHQAPASTVALPLSTTHGASGTFSRKDSSLWRPHPIHALENTASAQPLHPPLLFPKNLHGLRVHLG